MDDIPSNTDSNVDAPSPDAPEKEGRKRRASLDEGEITPKRMKHDDHFREATSERPRRGSSQSRRGSHENSATAEADRRRLATQEEKKRGKRLFGGLLNTLSQTTGGAQQRRRQEIERRQQERLQKQKVDDDKAMEEKRARLTEIRIGEQIVFDEEVMRNRHSKMLAMAPYLRTKSHPQIYYLPWKLTESQEDEIDDQVRHAKATVEREAEAFKVRKERHSSAAGRGRRTLTPVNAFVPAPASEAPADKPQSTNGSEHSARALEKEHHHVQHHHHHHHNHHNHQHHHHDESADVVEEAEEDMVIY
ncbi:hypothetical protein ACJ41O_004173 [Fusarium nematophilum]